MNLNLQCEYLGNCLSFALLKYNCHEYNLLLNYKGFVFSSKLYLSIIEYMPLYINSISSETAGKMNEIIPTINESLLIHWH